MTKKIFFPAIFILLFVFSCNNSAEKIEWNGIWEYSNQTELINYTITIDKKNGENYNCKIEAVGIQTYYLIKCTGKETETGFEIFYNEVIDGGFFQAEFLENQKPILTLTSKDGKIISNWNQLVGGESGVVGFVKKP